METTLQIWQDQTQLAQIKEIYGKKLTDGEFSILCAVGQATGLNPFMREVWAVKYGSEAAQIFIGRDGYRKVAMNHPLYDYHQVDAVYENDTFRVKDGQVEHEPQYAKDRGVLYGAYCIVHRKGSTRPIYVFVDFKEYNTGKSVWSQKPATMIKKVAEAQALRMAFPSSFNGTYDESEDWHDKEAQRKDSAIEVTPEFEEPTFKRGVEAVYLLTLTKVEELMFLLGKDLMQAPKMIDSKVSASFPGRTIYDLTKKEMETILGDVVRAIEGEKQKIDNLTVEEAIEGEPILDTEPAPNTPTDEQ